MTPKQSIKIHLTGADPYQWALAEDYDQTELAVESFVEFVTADSSDLIHSVYWESLQDIPVEVLQNKMVICNLAGEWKRYEADFGQRFLKIADHVNIWMVRSKAAQQDLQEKGRRSYYIPYTVNTTLFKPLSEQDKSFVRLKMPKGKYVIGNFMRDTQGGRGCKPKSVKGPDIFADIVTRLHQAGQPIHVLLAGPRRHWLRKELKKRGVPYSFYGWAVPFEDMRINTLNREKLNVLYNVLDLSIVSSRSEAGPHAILEAAAAKCPQLSTRVGIAADVLPTDQLYNNVEEAVELVVRDINNHVLQSNLDEIYHNTCKLHTFKSVKMLYQQLYDMAQSEDALAS